jgi:signal transduction histidine kinase
LTSSSLDTLHSLARALAEGEFRARGVLGRICSCIAGDFELTRTAIFRYLPDTDAVVPFVAHGADPAAVGSVPMPAPLARIELFRRARDAGKAVFVADVPGERALSERAIETFGVRSLLVVPLMSEGDCLGFLVGDRPGETFSLEPEALELLDAIGAFTAVVLKRAIEHSELRRLNELKSEFIALASHELRTPASVVYGISWTLEERGDGLTAEQEAELRRTLFEQAQRLRTLVDQLLDLSRLEAHGVRIAPERFAVRQRLEELVATVAAGHTCDVVVDARSDLEVRADAEAFDRVVSNLIGNALRYGRPPVRVGAERINGDLSVHVEDRGDGVPDDFVPRLFERFARCRGTVDTSGGAGLGLAIAQSYAKAHGGYITYERGDPNGARFRFVLPAVV